MFRLYITMPSAAWLKLRDFRKGNRMLGFKMGPISFMTTGLVPWIFDPKVPLKKIHFRRRVRSKIAQRFTINTEQNVLGLCQTSIGTWLCHSAPDSGFCANGAVALPIASCARGLDLALHPDGSIRRSVLRAPASQRLGLRGMWMQKVLLLLQ